MKLNLRLPSKPLIFASNKPNEQVSAGMEKSSSATN